MLLCICTPYLLKNIYSENFDKNPVNLEADFTTTFNSKSVSYFFHAAIMIRDRFFRFFQELISTVSRLHLELDWVYLPTLHAESLVLLPLWFWLFWCCQYLSWRYNGTIVLDGFGLPNVFYESRDLESKHHMIYGVVWIYSVFQTFLKGLNKFLRLEKWVEEIMTLIMITFAFGAFPLYNTWQ